MPKIVRAEVAQQAREALKEMGDRMRELSEPCDHSVGICWCDYHRAMDKGLAAVWAIDEALRGTK